MKKLLGILLSLVLIFLTFSACGNDGIYMNVAGTDVKEGIYNYFFCEARRNNDKPEAKKEAEKECVNLIAAKFLMDKYNLTLSSANKRKVSEDTENLWGMYKKSYEENGVAKSDINRVCQYKYEKQELLHFFFGKGGESEVSEMALKEEFVKLYVGFKAVEKPLKKTLKTGETVDLSQKEIDSLIELFRDYAREINNGKKTIDEINEEFTSSEGLIVTSDLPVILAKKDSPAYDDEFFDKVIDIPHGFARAVKSGSTLYLIEREVIATYEDDEFFRYSDEVLSHMKLKEIDEMVRAEADKLDVLIY